MLLRARLYLAPEGPQGRVYLIAGLIPWPVRYDSPVFLELRFPVHYFTPKKISIKTAIKIAIVSEFFIASHPIHDGRMVAPAQDATD
jgi:hypothetical protein